MATDASRKSAAERSGKKSYFFGRKTSHGANDELADFLRNELEDHFERLSQKFTSDDLLHPMKELIEDLFHHHNAALSFQRYPQEAESDVTRAAVKAGKIRSPAQTTDLSSFLHRKCVAWHEDQNTLGITGERPKSKENKGHDKKHRQKIARSCTTASVNSMASTGSRFAHFHMLEQPDHRVRQSHDNSADSTERRKQKVCISHSESSEDEGYSLLAEINAETISHPRPCRSMATSNGYTPHCRRSADKDQTMHDSLKLVSGEGHESNAGRLSRFSPSKPQYARDGDNESSTSEEDENDSSLWKFVRGKKFDYIFCGILAVNSIMLGLETDYCARNWSEDLPIQYAFVNRVFCGLFVLELVLRIPAYGPRVFFTGNAWKYNLFDFIVVCLQVADESSRILFTTFGIRKSGNSKVIYVMRLLRYFRLLRIMRLSRAMAFLVSVRVLVASIVASLRSLGWLLFLIGLQTFVASIPLTQLATDYKLAIVESDVNEEVEKFYGSIDRTMLALYEMLADGLHWDELMRPLVEHTSPWLTVFFIVYSAFSIFAMMNVVTGVFVDSALVTAEDSRKRSLLQNMRDVFLESDENMNGSISLEEFELKMMTNPQMQYFLKAIDIVPSDARQLFMLLDADGSGEIDAEELIVGCSRLQGAAKALDLAALMYMFSKQIKAWDYQFEQIDATLNVIIREAAGWRESVGVS